MDPSIDPNLAAFLEAAGKIAATQDLTEDLRASTRNLSIIFTVLAVVFVILRLLARFKQKQRCGTDDWLMLVSLLFLFGNFGCTIAFVNNNLGLHSGALSLDDLINIGKILLVNEPLYVLNITLIKLSLLFMYYRIFPLRNMKISAYFLGGISIAWTVSLIILSQLICTPYEKNFKPWVAGRCLNLKATFLAISVPSIVTDIVILSLPLPHVWRLQTNTAQKVSLIAIFLLGSFVVFTSIYRFTVFVNYDPSDPSYTLANGVAWNIVELSSGIISACLPCLGPLVRIMFKSVMPSRVSSKGPSRAYSPGLSGNVTIGGTGRNSRSHSQSWNKLSDFPSPVNSEAGHGSTTTTIIDKGNEIDRTSDSIPLGPIQKHSDVVWTEERFIASSSEDDLRR